MKLLNDGLKCEICGFIGKSLTSHITRKHKMQIKEYKKQFPESIISFVTNEQREKISKKVKANFKDENFREFYRSVPRSILQIEFWLKRGYTDEQQIKEIISREQVKRYEKGREKIIASITGLKAGDKNPMSLVSIAKRNNCTIEEASKLTPCFGRIGEKHPFFGKHHDEESKTKIAKNMPKVFYNTSSGQIDLLNRLNCKYNGIFDDRKGVGPYNCDMVNEELKLVIEYFGDYWHCNPKIWDEDHIVKKTGITAKDVWERDSKKINFLKNLGYEVVVIWASDFYKNKEKTMEAVCNVIDRKKKS